MDVCTDANPDTKDLFASRQVVDGAGRRDLRSAAIVVAACHMALQKILYPVVGVLLRSRAIFASI